MKVCINTTAILTLLTLFVSTDAAGKWDTDESCSQQAAAFLASQFGVIHNSAVSMASKLETPNTATNTYVQYMFGTPQTNYVPASFPKAVFGGGGGILGLANIEGLGDQGSLGPGDVLVYCDMSAYEPPEEGGTLWFNIFNDVYESDTDGALESCYLGQPTQVVGGFSPNAFFMPKTPPDGPEVLVFCGWFMARAMSAPYPNIEQFNGDFLKLQLAYDAAYHPNIAWVPIDSYKLFDSVFMHELIHTNSSGDKLDVAGMNSYGWTNARALSTNTDPQTGAQNNVDNFVELKLANDFSTLTGGTVNADGSLVQGSVVEV